MHARIRLRPHTCASALTGQARAIAFARPLKLRASLPLARLRVEASRRRLHVANTSSSELVTARNAAGTGGFLIVISPSELQLRSLIRTFSAAANVISRREETAATRSLVNTARLMADQPILLRLKELEAMQEIAARIHEVRVVVGADDLKSLLPSQLLGPVE